MEPRFYSQPSSGLVSTDKRESSYRPVHDAQELRFFLPDGLDLEDDNILDESSVLFPVPAQRPSYDAFPADGYRSRVDSDSRSRCDFKRPEKLVLPPRELPVEYSTNDRSEIRSRPKSLDEQSNTAQAQTRPRSTTEQIARPSHFAQIAGLKADAAPFQPQTMRADVRLKPQILQEDVQLKSSTMCAEDVRLKLTTMRAEDIRLKLTTMCAEDVRLKPSTMCAEDIRPKPPTMRAEVQLNPQEMCVDERLKPPEANLLAESSPPPAMLSSPLVPPNSPSPVLCHSIFEQLHHPHSRENSRTLQPVDPYAESSFWDSQPTFPVFNHIRNIHQQRNLENCARLGSRFAPVYDNILSTDPRMALPMMKQVRLSPDARSMAGSVNEAFDLRQFENIRNDNMRTREAGKMTKRSECLPNSSVSREIAMKCQGDSTKQLKSDVATRRSLVEKSVKFRQELKRPRRRVALRRQLESPKVVSAPPGRACDEATPRAFLDVVSETEPKDELMLEFVGTPECFAAAERKAEESDVVVDKSPELLKIPPSSVGKRMSPRDGKDVYKIVRRQSKLKQRRSKPPKLSKTIVKSRCDIDLSLGLDLSSGSSRDVSPVSAERDPSSPVDHPPPRAFVEWLAVWIIFVISFLNPRRMNLMSSDSPMCRRLARITIRTAHMIGEALWYFLSFMLMIHKQTLCTPRGDHLWFVALVCFPYIVNFISSLAPPWVNSVAWYILLMYALWTDGPEIPVALFRVLLPIVFCFGGVASVSLVVDLNCSERMVAAHLLISYRNLQLLHPMFLLSFGGELLIALFFGDYFIVQWCILATAVSVLRHTTPVDDSLEADLFPGEDTTSFSYVLDAYLEYSIFVRFVRFFLPSKLTSSVENSNDPATKVAPNSSGRTDVSQSSTTRRRKKFRDIM
eukprot:175_1